MEVAGGADSNDFLFEQEVYTEETLAQAMKVLMGMNGNEHCVECGGEPAWASVNLGVLLCIVCSGVHRNLGVHISRVKSVFLDKWKKEELQVLRDIGNTKALLEWEMHLPSFFVRPKTADPVCIKEHFIRLKYQKKVFHKDSPLVQEITQNGLPFKEGMLTKQGIKVKNWKKRHFAMSGTMLSYFKKPKDPFPAGTIIFSDVACTIDIPEDPVDKKNFCFAVQTPTREYFITADSAMEMCDWIQALRSARKRLCSVKEHGKVASDVNLELATTMSSSLSIQKQKLNKKTYPNCFVGTAAVDWLVANAELKSRSEAALVCSRLVEAKQLIGLTTPTFVDDLQLYQFSKP